MGWIVVRGKNPLENESKQKYKTTSELNPVCIVFLFYTLHARGALNDTLVIPSYYIVYDGVMSYVYMCVVCSPFTLYSPPKKARPMATIPRFTFI